MTVQLDWPPEIVNWLMDEARQKGLSLDAYVLQTLIEAAEQEARDEAGRRIRELRKGNILGPDLTIRDLIEEGRRF